MWKSDVDFIFCELHKMCSLIWCVRNRVDCMQLTDEFPTEFTVQ